MIRIGILGDIGSGKSYVTAGIITASSFKGDGSALTGVDGTLDNWLYG